MLTLIGGPRAVIMLLGYQTWGQAALGATGVGVAAVGLGGAAYLYFELDVQQLENGLSQAEIENHNRLIKAAGRLATNYGDELSREAVSQVNCRGAHRGGVENCRQAFADTVRRTQMMRTTLRLGGRSNKELDQAIYTSGLARATATLAQCLRAAGCLPKSCTPCEAEDGKK